jgi:hypothetical protein
MRTTLRISDDLMIHARRIAAESGRTLTSVIEDALRSAFSQRFAPRTAARVRLHTFKGKGLLPGVDLDDNSMLLDLMEKSRDPR